MEGISRFWSWVRRLRRVLGAVVEHKSENAFPRSISPDAAVDCEHTICAELREYILLVQMAPPWP